MQNNKIISQIKKQEQQKKKKKNTGQNLFKQSKHKVK